MSIRTAIALILVNITSAADADAQGHMPWQEPAVAAVVGRYEYRDDQLVGYIELRGDRTFEYKVDGLGPPVEGEGPFHLLYRGVWRFADFGNIALTNAPTTPPVLRQVSAVRDPKVRAALTITSTETGAVSVLGLLTDDGANGEMNMLTDGRWTVPLYQAWNTDEGKKGTPTRLPRNWEIVRSSDDLSLFKIALSPGGPNRFTFKYTPSPIGIFRLAAGPVDDEPGLMEVEFGTASIKMHRVPVTGQ